MPDQVPPHSGPVHQRRLQKGLLDTVFTQIANTGVDRPLNYSRLNGLGNSNQRHIFAGSARALGCKFYSLLYNGEPFAYFIRHSALNLSKATGEKPEERRIEGMEELKQLMRRAALSR